MFLGDTMPKKKPARKKAEKALITKDTPLGQIVQEFGFETANVMMKYGLHCVGCHVAAWESVEEGCKAHGMSDEDIKKLLKELNETAVQVVKDKKK